MSTALVPTCPVPSQAESRLDAETTLFSEAGAAVSPDMLSRVLVEHYRCPSEFLKFVQSGDEAGAVGYFRFGPNICYGHANSGTLPSEAKGLLEDVSLETVVAEGTVALPFDPNEIVDNLRLERYPHRRLSRCENILKKAYYSLRPFTNQSVRKQIQKFRARNWQNLAFPRWPVDTTVEDICESLLSLAMQASGAERVPFVWFWPHGIRGCVMMTHDVESAAGKDFCAELLDINDSFGIKASFQIVPEERYEVPSTLLEAIRGRGGEVGIQDLNHDGRLFDDRGEFRRRAALINRYGREYAAQGFRAAILYRKPEWYGDLEFSYDMSIPNVAHLDPQRGGCCTVMPYFIGKVLELPVTTVQDYTLFHLLNERSIALWETQVGLILEKNGLASFIVHPDYVRDRDTRTVYEDLLAYLRDLREKAAAWFALPREVDAWWRARSQMSIVRHGNSWRIEGPGADRAVLAFANNIKGKVVYELADEKRGAVSASKNAALSSSNDFLQNVVRPQQ